MVKGLLIRVLGLVGRVGGQGFRVKGLLVRVLGLVGST